MGLRDGLTDWQTRRVGNVISVSVDVQAGAAETVLFLALPRGQITGRAVGGGFRVLEIAPEHLSTRLAFGLSITNSVSVLVILGGVLVADGIGPISTTIDPEVFDIVDVVVSDGVVTGRAICSRPCKLAAAVIDGEQRVLAGVVGEDVHLSHPINLPVATLSGFRLIVFAFDEGILLPESGNYAPPQLQDGSGEYGSGGYGDGVYGQAALNYGIGEYGDGGYGAASNYGAGNYNESVEYGV
jgi:hypothetical protein